MAATIVPGRDITGLVLAGGRGERMGGRDKGLELLQGRALAAHALERLRPQVASLAVNANRNLSAYEALGVPVWTDALPDHAGPLAGFETGLAHCTTPWLVTVPCDCPRFPLDLVARLAQAAQHHGVAVAMAAAREAEEGDIGQDGAMPAAPGHSPVRSQPVFCLLQRELLDSLREFLAAGGRKVDRWTRQHNACIVSFDEPQDDPMAFFNANTLAQLRALEAG